MAGVCCGGRPWRVGRGHPLVGHNGSQLACLGRHAVALRLSISSQVAQVTMSHDIFISYSRHDIDAVKPIKEELEKRGFSCWVNLSKPVDGTVDCSTIVLHFLSKYSQMSERALRVLRLSREKHKPLFIVRFNDDSIADSFTDYLVGIDIFDWRVTEQRKRFVAQLKHSINKVRLIAQLERLRREEKDVAKQLDILRCTIDLGKQREETSGKSNRFIRSFLDHICCAVPVGAAAWNGPEDDVKNLLQQANELERRAKVLRKWREDIEKQLAEIRIGESHTIMSVGTAGLTDAGSDIGIGVVSPATVSRDDSVMVQAVVDLIDDLPAAIEKAKSLDVANQAVERGTLAVQSVKNGAEMTFQLDIKGLEIEDEDRTQTHKWDGKPFSLQFFASVPNDIRNGTHPAKLLVFVDGRPVGRIGFVINVVDTPSGSSAPAPTEPRGYTEYFVSYSDKDLDRVLPRVQGLRIAEHDFHFFFDKYSLQAGQRYEKEIFDYIDNKADVFLLFWSANSAASEWVEKEWRHALSRQQSSDGIPDIVPVPLDRDCPPPPKELSHLHFGDILLNCAKGLGRGELQMEMR